MSAFCEVQFNDLKFYEKCGAGTSGCVYRAVWISQRRTVAVKKVLAFNTEAEVLNVLSHRNVVQFYGIVSEPPNFCLITEFAENGSLFDFLRLRQDVEFNFEHTLRWARDIGLGMNYLHSEAPVKIIHRDLKSKNVVIDRGLTCKICDFGASQFHESATLMSIQGTYPWMAPEKYEYSGLNDFETGRYHELQKMSRKMIQSLPVSELCDVWSYGVVLWELLTHKIPFEGLTAFQIMWLVVEDGKRLTIPGSCPEKFSRLLQKCWRTEAEERPSFREVLNQLDDMRDDVNLKLEADSQFVDRSAWQSEIDDWINKIKKIERNLESWEQHLHSRELWVKEQEKKLEQQFRVVEVMSYDVNSWRDVDVQQWIIQLANDGRHSRDLAQFAELFVRHDINGTRLLKITNYDLDAMGIKFGPVKELREAIEELRAHNTRLLNFPPLNATVPSRNISETYTRSVVLLVGCHLRAGRSVQEMKWKMYLEIDADDDETDGNSDNDVFCLIKQVLFISKQLPTGTIRLTQRPYVMERWISSRPQDISVKCVVDYEDIVRQPRNTKVDFSLKLNDVTGSVAPVQTDVTLTVTRQSTSPASAALAASSSSTVRGRMIHSESTPVLDGAWSTRQLEHAVPAINNRFYQESKWAGVVTRSEKPEYPAYNPQFPPAVPLISSSSSNRGSPSLQQQQQHHQPNVSSSSTSSVQSRDSALCDQDLDCFESSVRASGGGMRHCLTEADLYRGVSREVSSDSSGVFLSPSPGPHFGTPQFDTSRRQGPVLTMAEISRRLLSYDESSTIAVGSRQTTDSDFGGNPNSSLELRRLSSPSNVSDAADFERTSHYRSNSVRAAGSGDRRASAQSPASRGFPRDVATGADDSRSGRPMFSSGPTRHKKGKKGGISERDSGLTDQNNNTTSVKSYKVHGGNPKWSWR